VLLLNISLEHAGLEHHLKWLYHGFVVAVKISEQFE
jgi:hypothetical protein